MSKYGYGRTGQQAMADRWNTGAEKRQEAKERRESKRIADYKAQQKDGDKNG